MKKRALILLFIFAFSISAFSYDFSAVDDLVSGGIINHAFPGAQLIIGDNNDILYSKCYGNFTYDEFSSPVTEESIYDLASVTKVVATTSAIMILYEQQKFNLTDKVSAYIPEFGNNGKEDLTILNLLLHNSGLTAFVPFYKTYSTRSEVLDAIYNIGLEYQPETKSIYSDLNAVMLGLLVEKISGMDLNEFCKKNIFIPLDMHSTMFIPDEKIKERIAPTEYDSYWRMRQIQGEVHDETTSILGGISGNAGLFSNSTDLYKFMRVMMNKGKYYNPYTRGLTEEKLFSPEIISLFIKKYENVSYENSRALGWDTKPLAASTKYRIPCGELISDNCFGHTGYTGTSIWCDTDRNLVVIFLTNRVYPSRDNYGIRDIRPEIHNLAIQIISNQN